MDNALGEQLHPWPGDRNNLRRAENNEFYSCKVVVTYYTCGYPGFAGCSRTAGFSSTSTCKWYPRDTTDPSDLSRLLPMTCLNDKLPCSTSDSMECLLLLVPRVCPLKRGGLWAPTFHILPAPPLCQLPRGPLGTHGHMPSHAAGTAGWATCTYMKDNFYTLQFLSFKFKSQSHNHLRLYVSLELTHANSVKSHQQKVISFASSQNCSSFQIALSLFLLTLCTILPS